MKAHAFYIVMLSKVTMAPARVLTQSETPLHRPCHVLRVAQVPVRSARKSVGLVQ